MKKFVPFFVLLFMVVFSILGGGVWADTESATAQVCIGDEEFCTPSFAEGTTFAAVYGRPNGWGTLSQAGSNPDRAIQLTEAFANRVDVWNGANPTYVVVNPVLAAGSSGCNLSVLSNSFVQSLVTKAKAKGYYVMFDVQTAGCDPKTKMKQIIDNYLLDDNVFFDLDIEWIKSGSISANTINEIAAYYFDKRKAKGYTTPGIFAFYIFRFWQVVNPGALRHTYDNGSVVPIFDGYGSCSAKRNSTNRMINLFGKPYGGMEFQTKWGTRYDTCTAQQYFNEFSDMRIYASQ